MTQKTPSPEALIYCRTDRDILTLKSELAACFSEAAARVGTGSVTSDEIDDLIEHLRGTGRTATADRFYSFFVDVHSSSTNFKEGIDLLREQSVGHVVVPAIPSPEIEALIETAIEERTTCHFVPGPWSDGTVGMSDVMIRRAGPGEEWSGRPPIGYQVEDGHLIPGPDFDDVVATLRLVNWGKLSKRSAADELGCSRRTIGRCLDSPERYRLD